MDFLKKAGVRLYSVLLEDGRRSIKWEFPLHLECVELKPFIVANLQACLDELLTYEPGDKE